MTKKCNRLRGERPKAFWGALVGGAMNLIGSAISSKAQARAIRRQIEAQKEAAQTQLELSNNSNLASTLNSYAAATRSYNDEDYYNLKYRLGGNKCLGSSRIYITDGGDATKIGNNTFLLRGGSHEQTNETGQTGIGINVGGNEIEAEGGEVAQKKNGALRIFSAQPILNNGMSPAQAILRGYNKDSVFKQQQAFKKRNGLKDDGNKARHGTAVPYKRIHINEDGTFTDTLNNKNYTTSATNGEDVVITGKANHWKEAGKKDTSSYFDPMGAVNFITAAGAPILNANPSNIVGSIRNSKNAGDFLKHYMMQDTGGFINTKWAKEHPYLSLGINTIGDIGLGVGTNKAVDILRHPLEYGKYGYKLNKLYKKAGLLNRGEYKTAQENYEKLLDYYVGNKPYDEGALDYSYDVKVRDNTERKNPDIFYSYVTPSKGERVEFSRAYRKKATDNVFTEMHTPIRYGFDFGKSNDVKTYDDLMNHNPEYYKFLKETNLPWDEQSTVDAFLNRQQTSLRGVYASNDDSDDIVKKYLTQIQAKRKGGDRLNTNGGLYTSNSTGIANAFKNPTDGVSEGYIGKLHYDFGIDRNKPIAEQLRKYRSKIVRGGNNNVFAGTKYYNKSIKNARQKGAIAIEDKYGRSNGDILNVTERAYLPGSAKQQNITLQDLKKYSAQENQRGRWNTQGVTKETGDDELFIPKEYNRFDDFINEARIFMQPRREYDFNKVTKFQNDLMDRTINRSKYRNKLIDMSRRLLRRKERNSSDFDVTDIIPIMDFDEPFRFGGRCKLRNGGLTSKDRGSSKHPYSSVSSKDFAGGGRSYPIPTKADAVDALRLAGLHGRNDVKAKVYSRYPELRKKAEMGTIVYDGIPGTDSYRQRMYSGYDASPLDLLNILNYLDRDAGFVDENGNSKYITGIAPTPGIRGRSKILSDINKTNKVARRASVSRYFNSRQYHIQPNRTKVSESAIPVERYNNGRYTYQGQFKRWQQGTPYSQTGYPNSHITVSTEPNNAIRGNVGSWWSDFKTRMDLKSQAKQKRNNIDINNRLHKQEVIDRLRRIKVAGKQSKFTNDLNNYSNEQLGAMRPDSYWDKQMGRFINLSDKVSNVKEAVKYALTAGGIGAGASLYGLSRIKSDNNSNNNNNNVTQKDAKGKPISPYIAKPTDNNNIISNKQTPVKKQVTAKSITTRKPIVVSKTSKPVSKKLYGLNDNETKVINGQTYVRRGNQVFNTTTKVRYDYSNGKYTGHNKVYGVGDYSHVGKNFNDAFDAARAAGASRFRYNAGKYNQYTTSKETNVKKERLNRIIGSKRIAKRIGGLVLRPKARIGGSWKAPIYNTNKYRVSNRMRRQIATWEGSDFVGQNRKFNGDAIGVKERELRQIMGRTYNYLNDNQRDSLNSIYYNSRVDTFKNRFGKWFRNLNDAVDRGDERAFNNSLAGIRQSMTIGENRQGMSGLAKRRAWERNWFGNPIPMDSNETKAILKQQAEARMVQPTDNTRVIIQPEYIEVPAPVGHGIVPVDNPDPNLLQGNIKDNLINMGNRFRLEQRCGGKTRMRCGGKTRMRKVLGCESRPVKGMRSKLTWGDVVYPYRRNNNFDYWDVIDQEQKANDKGGISPWTTSNKYDVKVPYAITKSTPIIPYTSQVSTPTSKVTENNTVPTYIGNKSGMILRDADWYGLGADLVSSIGGGILGLGAYKNLNFDYNLPNFVEESPVTLNTTYHNEAQKSNVERNRLNSRNSILRNTMSGSTAVGRMQSVDTNALYQLNQLADEKTNKETELINQNLLNEQQVRARNAAAKNQYYNTVASIKNAAIQAKNEAELAKGQILSGTLQGIGNSFQNLINQGRQNYDDTQAMLMGVAASDYATPSRLLELGVDVGDDAALAGIYRSAMNIPNPGARPKREDYSDNTEYSYALTRWENQNKAYQRRNSYADLIKGRMSKKNLIKYGII